MIIKVLLLLILILINGVLSASEIAFISLDKFTLQNKKDKRKEKILSMKNEEGKFLSTIQVGITLAGFLASAFASDTFTDYLIDKGVLIINPSFTEGFLMIVITIILSFLTLIFGELVPKQIGRSNPLKVSYLTIDFIYIISKVFYPVIYLLTKTTDFICRLLKIKEKDDTLTEEDIKNLIIMGEKSGTIEEKEKDYILNVFKFNDKTASEIMTKKNKVITIDIKDTKKEIFAKVKNTHYTRFPVLDDDKILGFINVKDLIYRNYFNKQIDLLSFIHKVLEFSEDEMIDDIFRKMQKKHELFSVVTKNDKLVGILTMEDAIEEILGNIEDEYN